ncbi:MAG: hypothetical protein R3C11_05265 [Planctomycetaceae bacterium]
MLFSLVGYLIVTGTGIWGNNNPGFFCGWPIVNFVFWVGIGHAGTLISAILFLFRQNWRTSINRFAEAMTIFAVICAGLFPRDSRRSCLACLLALPHSEPDGDVAELPQSAAVGRVRGFHLRDCFASLLVHGDDSGPRDFPRSFDLQNQTLCLRHFLNGLDWF